MTRGRSGKLKWALALAALALMLGGGAWYWMARDGDAPEYQTALVSRGELIQAVTATGQLNPVVNVQVGSQISGMIQKLFVDFNSRVTAGQVIAQLDPATYRAALRQAEGELANARAALELARVKAARAAELRAKDLIPQADDDQARADLHQAEAAVAIKEAAVQKARVDVDRCTIVAPIDGIVISRNVDVGQTVAASLSAPTLFVIANDLTKMQINANVAEADVGGIAVGQDVDFTVDAFPAQTFHGKVAQVRNAPITVQNVVTYDTIIEVGNPESKLKPGMTANVSIIVARREGVLTIPNAALRFRPPDATGNGQQARSTPSEQRRGQNGARSNGGSAGRTAGERPTRTVYVLPTSQANGTPTPVPIKTGISDGLSTEVLDGLNEGDRVVTGLLTTQSVSSPTTNPFGGRRRF
jgi:HlyD family secretion protein